MKQFRQSISSFYRKSFFQKHWYILAFAGMISLSAFHAGSEKAANTEQLMYKLPDSLTAIDHSFTQQLLREYRKKKVADSLVNFAQQLEGKPYRWGGTTLKGFDCSGFVSYVYRQFGHALNRTSSSQSTEGTPVKPDELQKGDLLFFTGTNANTRRVGHVGIVVATEGDEIRFVHASSNGGVKVSELQGYYENRFLSARRMLNLN